MLCRGLRCVQVRNEKARRFLASMRKKPGVDLAAYFPRADAGALALLRRLLAFDPADRPSAEEALADPYFHNLHSPAREPSAQVGFLSSVSIGAVCHGVPSCNNTAQLSMELTRSQPCGWASTAVLSCLASSSFRWGVHSCSFSVLTSLRADVCLVVCVVCAAAAAAGHLQAGV